MITPENTITEPTRVKNFARFFKNYMSIWSLVIAALPIPITSFNLIPVFSFQKEVLSTYTTLFCFLLLGFIFYSRHGIAKFFFPVYYYRKRRQEILDNTYDQENFGQNIVEYKQSRLNSFEHAYDRIARMAQIINSLPVILIVLSISSAFYYNFLVEELLFSTKDISREQFLKTEFLSPARSTLLMALYLGIFLFAEAAFILMAVKEYLQDLLLISDESLMLRIFKEIQSERVSIETKD